MVFGVGDEFKVGADIYSVDCIVNSNGGTTFVSLLPEGGVSEDGLMKTPDEIEEYLESGQWVRVG